MNRLDRPSRTAVCEAVERYRYRTMSRSTLSRELVVLGFTAEEADKHVALVEATEIL